MSNDYPKLNLSLAKKLNIAAYIFSAVVILLVGGMHKVHIDHGIDFTFLPGVYSFFNALTAVVLIYALVQIKKKNIKAHKNAIYLAMFFSAMFLLMYVVYHISYPDTKYCKEGWIWYAYITMLILHIVIAALILPFILFTFIRAYTGQIDRHVKIARWVFPFWLYVAISGPILYIMIRPCYTWMIN